MAANDQQREERRAQAAKHLGLMRGAFAKETAATVDAAEIYEEGVGRDLPLPEAPFDATETLVVTSFAPEALWRDGRGRTALVDPASFTRPGGAYEDGALGPEQILCSESNLYEVLCGIRGDFHDQNRDYRRGMLFTDRAAYLPDVVFLRGGTVKKADVIAVAEPLRARALENHRSERECDRALADRVETLLRIAAANGCETLICGAFACGRLGYDPQQVITLFQEWIAAHPGAIGRIVFAVPRAYVDTFRDAFGAPEPVAAAPVADAGEAEDDEDDWRSIELPEGITIR
ncbi:MAG: TIGR02452 family protein [Eggerthellaceae bacterium]|nr:TIGR02452 family protein [Eggerthellaceae bacterium]